MPVGWYSVMRQVGIGYRGQRVGIYCSPACVGRAMPEVSETAAQMGDSWLEFARSESAWR